MRVWRRAAAWRTCRRPRSTSCSIPARPGCTPCSATARWRCSTPAAKTTTPRRSSSATATSTCRSCAMPGASSCEITQCAGRRPSSTAQMIHGIKEHLFAVLRDIIYTANEIIGVGRLDCAAIRPRSPMRFSASCATRAYSNYKARPNLVVCWGGHSIGDAEYRYAKRVGYELGLRGARCLHRLRAGRHEGADEGRRRRARQAAHRRTAASSASPSPASSPPSRPTPSSISW